MPPAAQTTDPANDIKPDLADRMMMSLRRSDLTVQGMAEYLEVNRNTVGNWLAGRSRPNPATLKMWAARTNVKYEWLRGPEDHKDRRGRPSRSKP